MMDGEHLLVQDDVLGSTEKRTISPEEKCLQNKELLQPQQQEEEEDKEDEVRIPAFQIQDPLPISESYKRLKDKDFRWMSRFLELREFKDTHGHCVVPRKYPLNPHLATWVAEQRKQRKLLADGKQSSMIQPRLLLLNEIGFSWNVRNSAWLRHVKDLESFREERGHCLVPVGDPKYPKLGSWVKEQRRNFGLMKEGKSSSMTEERVSQLNVLGFCWNAYEALWLERFEELREYKNFHGHCLVPTRGGPENQRLGTWVHHQRQEYKLFTQGKPSRMTKERMQSLEALDFVWYPSRLKPKKY